MTRFLSYVSLAAFLAGCGPSLDQVVRTTQAFGVQQRCSQGPFEIHVPAFGSRWGEDITLEARGNAVEGHTTIQIADKSTTESTYSSTSAPNASACMLSDADRSALAASVNGGGASSAPSGTSTGATTDTSASTKANVALVEAGIPNTWLYRTEIGHYHNEVVDWHQAQSVLKRGQDVKIIFWSEHPVDLQNTIFVLTHSEMVAPGGDDKKWQAHLDEVKAGQDEEEQERIAKAREETRCQNVLAAPDAKCKSEGYKTGGELIAYADLQRRCESLAKNNATDQPCRDDGWRNANERPDTQQATQTPTQTQTQTPPPPPPPPPPTRPPPAPREEAQSPKPSTNAEWIPGSWQWSGTDWAWLSGGWRVPDQDRAQKLTATAPTAPPATRMEVRPIQPIASAVWAEGYWHYAAGQWIWVPGRWAVPPRTGATWRPSTWIPDGARLRLDPGGWR